MSSQSGLIWIQTDTSSFSSRTTAASWVTSQLTQPWLEKEFSSVFCPLISIWVPLSISHGYSCLTKALMLLINHGTFIPTGCEYVSVKVDKSMPLLSFLPSSLWCLRSQFINGHLSIIVVDTHWSITTKPFSIDVNINVSIVVDWWNKQMELNSLPLLCKKANLNEPRINITVSNYNFQGPELTFQACQWACAWPVPWQPWQSNLSELSHFVIAVMNCHGTGSTEEIISCYV